MYKLLLATDQPVIRELFEHGIAWDREGFSKPIITDTPKEAIALLKTKPIDAVGFYLCNIQADTLLLYLQAERASLPIFSVYPTAEKQVVVLKELSKLLNRLHSDFADEVYDEAAMMDIAREELTHLLLSGGITKKEVLIRWLQMIRARIAYDEPCMLFELDMPQGEVYLTNLWHHGQERLENALRSNFFNRYAEGIYYAVAVLSNRHIRLVAVQGRGLNLDTATLARKTNAHVRDTIETIKEYLDLDIRVVESGLLNSLTDFIVEPEGKTTQA